jgi:hypothetical protein
MAALWLQQKGDEPVWHHATERIEEGWYRTACRWEIRLRDTRAVWPAKADETGPDAGDRCRTCVAVDSEEDGVT